MLSILIFVGFSQGDDVVLQSVFTSQEEHLKLCLAAEGFGSRLCRLEATSNCKVKGCTPMIVQFFLIAGAVHLSSIVTLHHSWNLKWEMCKKSKYITKKCLNVWQAQKCCPFYLTPSYIVIKHSYCNICVWTVCYFAVSKSLFSYSFLLLTNL